MTSGIISIAILGQVPLSLSCGAAVAQTDHDRVLSGVVITDKNESVAGAIVIARHASGESKGVSDAEGKFRLIVPAGALTLKVEGKNLASVEKRIGVGEATEKLEIRLKYVVPPVHESVVIQATALDPGIDRRDDAVYKGTLFSRGDQVFQTLNAGINAGQHEGGGKSLEIRRFGFNLDHGGVSGVVSNAADAGRLARIS